MPSITPIAPASSRSVAGEFASPVRGNWPGAPTVKLTLGATGAEKNYTILYLIGAVLALLRGLVIALKVKSVR